MDDQSRDQNQSDGTIGEQIQELSCFQLPTTPSIAPTLAAPNGTDTPASELESRVWLVAQHPGTLLEYADLELLHDGEHARLRQTPLGDIASIEPDDPRSVVTRRPKRHPRGTEYSLMEDTRGPNEDGRMVGVLKVINRDCVNGSRFGLPEDSLVEVARETLLKPIVANPRGHADEYSQQPPAESDTTSRITGFVGRSPQDGFRRSRQSRE